ncbi:MAG: hypothetical protein AABX83_00415 [Nanoarchaeota archaeon]
MRFSVHLNFFKRVFSNVKYVFIAIIISILFYSLNVLIANYKTIIDFYLSLGFFGTIKLFINLAMGFYNSILLSSFISLVAISILLGILSSLIFYRINILKQAMGKSSFLATLGTFLGIFAPGCAACGLGLASTLGLSAVFLAFLPLKGLELSFLAIIILTIAIFKTSNDSCKIMIKNKNERRL